MAELSSAILLLLDWQVIAALLIGSIGGCIIGAIPGVGPAIAIAILLPATFALEPIVGLTMLLGIYGSSMFGGAIPAILINAPGTAVNALTTYDGYPMTQRGEVRRALSLAYSASFAGAILSILCLVMFTPILADIAPLFGSREIFLAAFLGILLVVLAHRGQIFAAAMMACFGLFLNFVGFESITYTERYTFGQDWLRGGVNLIVVVLGLFAISQALLLLLKENETPVADSVNGNMFAGMKELWLYMRPVRDYRYSTC